jgi:dimethylamine/trimethylamine dehydrogenase
VLVYDDDHYYMGGVLAEVLLKAGCTVTLVTPSVKVSEWAANTLEQGFIQQRLLTRGRRCAGDAGAGFAQAPARR